MTAFARAANIFFFQLQDHDSVANKSRESHKTCHQIVQSHRSRYVRLACVDTFGVFSAMVRPAQTPANQTEREYGNSQRVLGKMPRKRFLSDRGDKN